MKQLVIFDIDGTVCDISQRLHHINFDQKIHNTSEYFKKNWKMFFKDCIFDKPKLDVIAILHNLQMFCDIKFFSGRSDVVRKETEQWLDKHIQLLTLDVTMRKHGDHREDFVVKQEMYDALSNEDKERLLCVFDDRDQVVKMWRDNNILCCQIAYGDF